MRPVPFTSMIHHVDDWWKRVEYRSPHDPANAMPQITRAPKQSIEQRLRTRQAERNKETRK